MSIKQRILFAFSGLALLAGAAVPAAAHDGYYGRPRVYAPYRPPAYVYQPPVVHRPPPVHFRPWRAYEPEPYWRRPRHNGWGW